MKIIPSSPSPSPRPIALVIHTASPERHQACTGELERLGFRCFAPGEAENEAANVVDGAGPEAESVCQKLRAGAAQAFVIVWVESATEAEVRRWLGAGADDVAEGPVEALSRRVEIALALRNREKEPAPVSPRGEDVAERFRSVWENSADGMRLTDGDGIILGVNPAFCAMVEMSEAELIGRPLNVVFSEREDREGMLARYQQRFREGVRDARFGRWLHLSSGKLRFLEFTLSRFTGRTGEQCLTMVRDRTERRNAEESLKRSEQQFRSIWEQTSDGMRLTDENGIILNVNEAYCRLVGLRREDLVGQPISSIYAKGRNAQTILDDHAARFSLTSPDFRPITASLSQMASIM